MKVCVPDHDRVIKIFVDRGLFVSGKDLKSESTKWKNWLLSQNISKLGICMGNCPAFLYAVFGALRAGIPVVLVPVTGNIEIPQCTLVYDADNKHISRRDGMNVHEIQFQDANDDKEDYDWAKNEAIIYNCTSGTSGQRKWIGKSFHDYVPAYSVNGLRLLGKLFPLRVFNTSPWYHNTGISVFLLLAFGIQYCELCMDSFNPIKAKSALLQFNPNVWIGTSSMLHRVCVSDQRDNRIAKINLLTGEAIPVKQLKNIGSIDGFGLALCIYGATETGTIASMCCVGEKKSLFIRIFSAILRMSKIAGTTLQIAELEEYMVGDVVPDAHVRITDADENGIGRIYAKTPATIGKTETVFWDTGDLGYVKGRSLYVVGRAGNVINKSGSKILAGDIEKLITSIPGVTGANAFGIPSEMYGEEICLVVEGKLTQEQIRNALPKRWWPSQIAYFDSFPLNASGKQDIKMIREMVLNGQCCITEMC